MSTELEQDPWEGGGNEIDGEGEEEVEEEVGRGDMEQDRNRRQEKTPVGWRNRKDENREGAGQTDGGRRWWEHRSGGSGVSDEDSKEPGERSS